MTWCTAILLLLLAVWVRALLGTWLNPAVLFPAAWAVVLAMLAMVEGIWIDRLYSGAILVFVLGALFFVMGALLLQVVEIRSNKIIFYGPNDRLSWSLNYKNLASASVMVHLVMLPIWWFDVRRIAGNVSSITALAYQLRVATAQNVAQLGILSGNYLALGLIAVPLLLVGQSQGDISRRRFAIASVPWVITNLISGGRSALVSMIVAGFYLLGLRGRRLTVGSVVVLVGLFFFVFVAGIILVGKEGVSAQSDLSDIASATAKNFFDYLLLGSILFGKYVSGHIIVNPEWDPFSSVCHIAAKFGLCTPGAQNLDFNSFAPDGRLGNVYTMYFSMYPGYGLAGVIVFAFLYGAWSSFHHRRASRSLPHALVSAYLIAAIALSMFTDSFGNSLYFLFKAFVAGHFINVFFGRGVNKTATGGLIVV